MFNLFNLFKTDAEKIAAAKFDKQKYQILKLENGQYGYNVIDSENSDFNFRSSNVFDSIDELLCQLEHNTKASATAIRIKSMKGEVL